MIILKVIFLPLKKHSFQKSQTTIVIKDSTHNSKWTNLIRE